MNDAPTSSAADGVMLRLPPEGLIQLTPDVWTAPFWEAAAQHRLVVPRCVGCGAFRFPPSPFCWRCRAQDVHWVERPGRGVVYSFTIVWHPIVPDLADTVPYAPAVVEIPDTDGVRIVGAVTDASPSDVHVGRAVELVWRDVRADVTVPTWRPV
jgi:uncharacterized OB-fold protein